MLSIRLYFWLSKDSLCYNEQKKIFYKIIVAKEQPDMKTHKGDKLG